MSGWWGLCESPLTRRTLKNLGQISISASPPLWLLLRSKKFPLVVRVKEFARANPKLASINVGFFKMMSFEIMASYCFCLFSFSSLAEASEALKVMRRNTLILSVSARS